MTRRLLAYGLDAVLLECAGLADALGVLPYVRAQPAVLEVVPGARTLLLRLARPLTDRERRQLLQVEGRPEQHDSTPAVSIDVEYAGPDLAEVGRHLGLTPAEVVAAHTAQTWSVAFCGFAPGFGYLRGEHDRLRVPRRAEPRTRVPAGSVGLADAWSGVYPRAGPAGWQLIGRTDAELWNLDRTPPALLQPGGRVRFVAVG